MHYKAYLLLVICSVAACGPRAPDRGVGQELPASARPTSPEPVAAPYEQVGSIEDTSYGNVRRVSIRVTIPPGHTREEVSETLKKASEELARRERAQAAMVLAYRPGDDTSSVYTVGRAVYAPNGRWEDAESSSPMYATIDLGSLYFEDSRTEELQRGSQVTLNSSLLDEVTVSSESGKWGSDYVVAKVPDGTRAEVLEHTTFTLTADHKMVRYRVRFMHRGKQREGWVSAGDIEEAPNSAAPADQKAPLSGR